MSNVSAVTNHFPTANEGFITTLGSTILASAVTVPLTSVSGLTNGTIFVGIIEPGQANQQTFTGTVDTAGVQITGVKWTRGTNVDHTAGVTIVDYVSGTGNNMFTKGITEEHNQDGTHDEALITSRTEDTDPDPDADFVLTYDTSATSLKKAKLSNLGGGDGWVKNVLPAVDSVTANGNRSYTVAFNSTVASTLSDGMRLRTTRTSAATTNAFSLDGANDYYSKTSPTGLSFTTTFTCSAWVYMTSYALGGIIGRRNGVTEGWNMEVAATGQISLVGLRIAGNNKSITSYQSIPLNRWVHVAATLDMAVGDTSAQKIWFDGVEVPRLYTLTGTATALVQGTTALVVGARYSDGTSTFPGYIDQAAVFSSQLSDATIKAMINQGLSGSESTLVSAFSNGSTTDLNTTNANNLTAQNGATTVASAPWGNRGTSSTLDYALVMSVSGANVTVQVPEGCTIPTSGGVSAVAYSTQANPYGFVSDGGRWMLASMLRTSLVTTSNATYGAFNSNGYALTVPIGQWVVGHRGGYLNNSTTTVYFNISKSALTGLSLSAGQDASPFAIFTKASAAANTTFYANAEYPQSLSTLSTYVMYTLGATTGGAIDGTGTLTQIYAIPSGL